MSRAALLVLAAATATAGALLNGATLSAGPAQASLAESLPDDIGFERPPGVLATGPAQVALVNSANRTLDIAVMYWSLKTCGMPPDDRTREQCLQDGSDEGVELWNSIAGAIRRNVTVRILQGSGISSDHPEEWRELVSLGGEGQVTVQLWNASLWYGSGIMHQKIFVVDSVSGYLGSANMDWLALTQILELGVVLRQAPDVVRDLQNYFNAWWRFSRPTLQPQTETVFDPVAQVKRQVPCWSQLVLKNQLAPCFNEVNVSCDAPASSIDNEISTTLSGEQSTVFITGSPAEVLTHGRSWDQDGLLTTILAAKKTVCVAVMDLFPGNGFSPPSELVWWPALNDALLTAASAKGAEVRLLVSLWVHTQRNVFPFLKALQATANAAHNQDSGQPAATGNLTVRFFAVPGWDLTGPFNIYPSFSRVSHAKFIVTDNRVNIGTSNMEWGYFANTAGSSFNSNHAGLRASLQAIFDRNWNSQYAEDVGIA